MQRGAQVVYPKDIGLILVYADIFPGATVLEAGTGSGSLTLALVARGGRGGPRDLLRASRGPSGAGGRRTSRTGTRASAASPRTSSSAMGDIFEGIPENGVDRLVLDLPEPWHAIGRDDGRLWSPAGSCAAYLPTVPQVQQTVEAMRRGGFCAREHLRGTRPDLERRRASPCARPPDGGPYRFPRHRPEAGSGHEGLVPRAWMPKFLPTIGVVFPSPRR